jgi:hypothetical protein
MRPASVGRARPSTTNLGSIMTAADHAAFRITVRTVASDRVLGLGRTTIRTASPSAGPVAIGPLYHQRDTGFLVDTAPRECENSHSLLF